jgi:hypothetical protein
VYPLARSSRAIPLANAPAPTNEIVFSFFTIAE